MYGYVRAAACAPKLKVADCSYNVAEIIGMVKTAYQKQVNVIVFPELSITGYTCADLFFQSALVQGAEQALLRLLEETKDMDILITVGIPVDVKNQLFNCAALCHRGKILGLVPKMYMPNSGEFGEKRWFSPAYDMPWHECMFCGQMVPMGNDILFNCGGDGPIIGIEICQDVWEPIPPSSYQALAGASLILNLSASNEVLSKQHMRRSIVVGQSGRTVSAYVYAASGIWESTTDIVFSGHSLICENGVLLEESKRFHKEAYILISDLDFELIQKERQKNNGFMACSNNGGYRNFRFVEVDLALKTPTKLIRKISQNPFIPEEKDAYNSACADVFNIQSIGLAGRLRHINCKAAVIGVSGGLDSSLALLAVANAFDFLGKDRKDIIGVTMPGFGTTSQSHKNAVRLMEALGITSREIDIKPACLQQFKDIGHSPDVYDVVYENVQARVRTQTIMNIANMENGIVVGTGDMSELALGFTTYNGDHMSMYNVNCSVPKTLVRIVTDWIWANELFGPAVSTVLPDILALPISPELLPGEKTGAQLTEGILGPYEINDFFMYYMLNYGFMPGKIILLCMQAFGGKYSQESLIKMLRSFYKRFFTQQYKRSCAPDGPKAVEIGLSPRSDWRMPSDAAYAVWIEALEDFEKLV